MFEWLNNGQVVIFDKEKKDFVRDEDGEEIIFKNRIAAKNFLFDLEFTGEFVWGNFSFVPVNTEINLN